MSIFISQNPGIGGLDEITDSEALFVQNLEGLSYAQGDVLYHDGSDLNRLPAGTSGQYLKTQGAGANPTWSTVAGSGDVSKVGTPVDGQIGVWTGDGTIEGDAALTFDTTTDTLSTVVVTASGAVTGSNLSGTNTGDSQTLANGVSDVTATATELNLLDLSGLTAGDVLSADTATTASWKAQTGGSGLSRSVNSVSTPTNAGSTASTDYVYLVSGTTTITLPTAVGNTNRYTITNVDTNIVTIDGDGSETINGTTTITLETQYESVDLISNNSNWIII